MQRFLRGLEMAKRYVVGALMGALMLVVTGCPSGDDNPVPPPGDAGTQVPDDAGTQQPDDAGTQQPDDAGTQTPGDMTLNEGEACTTTASCMAGLYCAESKCAPLHIAVTVGPTGATTTPIYAVVVPFNKPVSPTRLSESDSKFPRWNREGSAVAFVDIASDNSVSLVSRGIPALTGQATTPLTTGVAANTTDFRYMEWEPSNTIAWVQTSSTGSSTGIWSTSGSGPAVSTTPTGVFPSWAADGNSFVYSSNGLGLLKRVLGETSSSAVSGVSTTSEQPLHNKANDVVLYLDAKGQEEATLLTPLTGLYTINTAAAASTPSEIALPRDEGNPTIDGQIKSYIANHTWAPGGTHVAYVRVFYFKPSDPAGDAYLCSGANCGGQQGNVVYVRRIDPATGAAVGDEVKFADEATLPSFSPDGQFLAYVSGSQLKIQKIDPATGTAVAGSLISHNWSGENQRVLSNRGDDHRPRWQPR
jgi:Tol biopolymer transport system component